jgi:hypothetical protein
MAGFLQALTKPSQTIPHSVRRLAVEEANHGHRRLLSPRSERPCCCAAKQRDELASAPREIVR